MDAFQMDPNQLTKYVSGDKRHSVVTDRTNPISHTHFIVGNYIKTRDPLHINTEGS